MNLTGHQIVTLARNSFDACFCTQQQRDRWRAELEAVAGQEPDPAGPVTGS